MYCCALQVRLTGDPYIVHCVETALIVEALQASSKALEDIDERCGSGSAGNASFLSCTHLCAVATVLISVDQCMASSLCSRPGSLDIMSAWCCYPEAAWYDLQGRSGSHGSAAA
jgi:hypothetical protein